MIGKRDWAPAIAGEDPFERPTDPHNQISTGPKPSRRIRQCWLLFIVILPDRALNRPTNLGATQGLLALAAHAGSKPAITLDLLIHPSSPEIPLPSASWRVRMVRRRRCLLLAEQTDPGRRRCQSTFRWLRAQDFSDDQPRLGAGSCHRPVVGPLNFFAGTKSGVGSGFHDGVLRHSEQCKGYLPFPIDKKLLAGIDGDMTLQQLHRVPNSALCSLR
jgi:hypothetical protein